MNINKSTGAVILVIFLLCTAFLGYLILSGITEIQALNKQIEERKQAILIKQRTLEQLRKIKENAGILEDTYNTINVMIPAVISTENIVAEMQNYANKASVTMLSVNFGQITQSTDLLEMTLNMSFSGSYNSFLNLLYYILHGERLVKVNGIQIENGSDGLTINITAMVYFQAN